MMQASGLEAMVATSPENVTYATGLVIPIQRVVPERLVMTLIPRDGQPILITSSSEEMLARRNPRNYPVRSYTAAVDKHSLGISAPIAALADLLESLGLGKGRIGIEKFHVVARYYDELTKLLPASKIGACDPIFEEMRAVKSGPEVQALSVAAKATEEAVMKALAETEAGYSEADLARMLKRHLDGMGASSIHHFTVSAGQNSFTRDSPTDKVLRAGEVVYSDLGGAFGLGYLSDIGFTAIVGKPSTEQAATYRRLATAHRKTVEHIMPGLKGAEIYALSSRIFDECGLLPTRQLIGNIGHGIGLGLKELPTVNKVSGDVVAEGMVMCVEEDVESSTERYHIEDTILVTGSGPEYLTSFSESHELVPVGRPAT